MSPVLEVFLLGASFVVLLFLLVILGLRAFELINSQLCKLQLKRIEKLAKKEAELQEKERQRKRQQVEKFEQKRQEQIDKMLSQGYQKVGGLWGDYFIETDKSSVVAMYDINGKRVPLAYLGLSNKANVVGIDPVIYYDKYKVMPSQIIYDDIEIKRSKQSKGL